MQKIIFHLIALTLVVGSSTSAQQRVPKAAPMRLPMKTIFIGESKFHAVVAKAERENWRKLPIGDRTVKVANELLGVPYKNYTLEVDDTIESPVVNLRGMDCWTFYENSLAIARMIHHKPPPTSRRTCFT